jgi:multiple sugar transport system substrate-binding protein
MEINTQTDLQEEAWTFIEFMTSYESMKKRSLIGGYDPGRKALYSDPELTKNLPVLKLAKDILFKNGKSRPVTEYYGDMSLEMQEQFNIALKGEVSPQQAVKSLQKSLSSIMEQAE